MAQPTTDAELELLAERLQAKLYNYNLFKRFLIKSAAEGITWIKTFGAPLEIWCRQVIQKECPELSHKMRVAGMSLVEMRDNSLFVIHYHDWHWLFLRVLEMMIKSSVITAEQALDILNKIIDLLTVVESINYLNKKAESEETIKK